MRKLLIKDLDVVRAGSDYLQIAWSINVVDPEMKVGEHYEFRRADGSSFFAVAIRKETMDGKKTMLLVDSEDAFLFS